MRGVIGVFLLAGFAFAASQGEPGRSNALSAKEAAEGWLLLFDGETTFGWSATTDQLTAKDGGLHFEGGGKLHHHTAFHAFALEFQVRAAGAQAHKDVQLSFGGKTIDLGALKEKKPTFARGKLIVAGGRYKLSLSHPSNSLEVSGDLPDAGPSHIAFSVADGVKLELRDVTVVPLQMKPLFNGKNLDGWKEFPGKKSKFTVNNKLELNVKDGPGDLQTEGKYADFLLQLECFSNGKPDKALNSGIFFRCRAGEYQNGYEAQIHNGFTAEAKKAYIIEEYDPKTHQLTGKKTIKATAIDYGTGAIYRRVPARKAVAKEGEWFTMTVVAHGNHMATWVNGIQVVDWTDNRPLDTNPRNGCRLEAGHLSIQGHDPTTDLSFRNLRIAEYAAGQKK